MRLLKFLAGLLLIPVCASFALTAYHLFDQMIVAGVESGRGPGESAWLSAGFLLWLVVYIFLPTPVRTYVLGHELTHVLWACLSGGGVRAIHVGKDAGHVEVTAVNFLVMLAPYFFPLYTVLTLLIYGVVGLFADQTRWQPLWLGGIGLTYGFHVTFTLLALSHRQSDVEDNGKVFSYAVIVMMNLLSLALAMVAAASPTLAQMVEYLTADTERVGRWLSHWLITPLSGAED